MDRCGGSCGATQGGRDRRILYVARVSGDRDRRRSIARHALTCSAICCENVAFGAGGSASTWNSCPPPISKPYGPFFLISPGWMVLPLLRRLRAVKTTGAKSIRLRRAAKAAEGGLVRMAAAINPAGRLSNFLRLEAGAQDTAKAGGFALSGTWDFISAGTDLSNMDRSCGARDADQGDVGTLVDGYSSDGARTFTYGSPSG